MMCERATTAAYQFFPERDCETWDWELGMEGVLPCFDAKL